MGSAMKRLGIIWLLGALWIGSPWAEPPPGPRDLVVSTSQQVMAALRREKDSLRDHPERLYDLVEKLVVPHFDFERMSKWVLGKHWRSASPDQRARFIEQFRTLLVRTYASALLDYTDQRIEYQPLRERPDGAHVTVRTRVQPPGGFPIPINYTMHRSGDEWKVMDVSVDGVSLVTTYRGSFARQVRRSGIDGLIASLEQRNAQVGP
jgi:phospholipid transport system substrate-binding protein